MAFFIWQHMSVLLKSGFKQLRLTISIPGGTIQDGPSHQVGRRGCRGRALRDDSRNPGQVRVRLLRPRRRHHHDC